MTAIPRYWILAPSILCLGYAGCASGGVGDPCIPEDEYQTQFEGFSVDEVNVESRSFQCETRLCLVNHFQGRVSCPYGQTADDVNTKPGTDPARCRVPGTSGEDPADQITAVIDSQDLDRRPENAVYCSCRCDGPDPNARYCECPSGFSCEKLVDDLGLGSGQLAGSYCVREGTVYQKNMKGGPACDRLAANCGGEGKNPGAQ